MYFRKVLNDLNSFPSVSPDVSIWHTGGRPLRNAPSRPGLGGIPGIPESGRGIGEGKLLPY